MDDTIGFPDAYPRGSDLSSGHSYPPFEQLKPGLFQREGEVVKRRRMS